MDTYDTVDSDDHPDERPWLNRLIKIGLFLLAQSIAVLLVSFVALLVSFETSWSATTEQASLLQPGDANSGTPATEGRHHDRSHPPRDRFRHHGLRPDAAHARHAGLS